MSRARFERLWGRAGLYGSADSIYDDLERRHSEPQRAYHTLQHLEEMLAISERIVVDELLQEESLICLELAIWFHDVVYDPRASDNEEQSATLARTVLSEAGARSSIVTEVVEMIVSTKSHVATGSDAQHWLIDLDLAILGASPERFAEYERQIRFEYSWVPDDAYSAARAAVLRGFLERDRLYLNREMRYLYEASARRNLKASLQGLPPA